MWFMQNAMVKPDNAGAGSTDYMHLFGLVALGYMWALMAKAAAARLAEGADGSARVLRNASCGSAASTWSGRCRRRPLRLARIEAGAETMMGMPAEAF